MSWRQKFLYDRYGNRRIDSNSTDTSPDLVGPNPVLAEANNRIVAQPGEQYEYDGAGNLTRGREGQTYAFDGENKMTLFNGGSLQGGATYSSDGDGKRVKTEVGNATTIFVYDIMGQLVAEYSDSPTETNGTQYLTSDHLGSPRVITDSNGVVKTRHDYHPFGEEVVPRGGRNDQNGYVSDNLRQKFTSKERDNETGLDYFIARYYGSTAGRFMSVDPLAGHTEDPQTLNRYVYARNNPLKYIDPDGLDFWILGQGNYCKENGRCDKDGYVVDGKGNRVTVTNGQIRNRADSICSTCEQGEYTASGNEAGVQITNGQGQTFTGTFTENAVKLLGDDKLKDFTFNITGSNLKEGVLASGTFDYNGTNQQTRQTLSERGAFSYLLDPLNRFHPGTTQYRFAKFPPVSTIMAGSLSAMRQQAEDFGTSSHLSVANRPKSNVPKTTGEWHVDNSTGVRHIGCATLGVRCK